MSKKKIKLLAVGVVLLVLVGLFAVDFSISRQYSYELVAKSDDYVIADGVSSVKLRFALTRHGQPIEGHTIYIYPSNGSLPSSRCVTDEKGYFTFTYYPYLYINDKISPLEDVTFYFQDESNSFFFTVPAKGEYTMDCVKPEAGGMGEDWQGIPIGE